MKICPECALTNEERFPTCVMCHTPLADVCSTPSADPDHPEHARLALTRERHRLGQRQLGWAAVCYVLVITGSALWPGCVLDPDVQGMYALCGLIVALAVLQEIVGAFLAGLLQGAFSVTLVLWFGPVQPFAFYMLAGHVLTPMVLCHWIDLIHDANR